MAILTYEPQVFENEFKKIEQKRFTVPYLDLKDASSQTQQKFRKK